MFICAKLARAGLNGQSIDSKECYISKLAHDVLRQ